MPNRPQLALRGVNKSFGAVHVLKDAYLTLNAGEVTALVGDNGAGKSTLVKCIAGIHDIDSGEIEYDGRRVQLAGPRSAAELGIEVVYQDLSLCDNLNIYENMFLGRELHQRSRLLDEHAMQGRAAAALSSLSVRTVQSLHQTVSSLSGGQRQTVAIAKAALWDNKVVVLDEPTAALGVAQTEQVLRLVRRLAEQGRAVLLISHNMHDVMSVADRITVLYLGRTVAELVAAETSQREVVEYMTGGHAETASDSPAPTPAPLSPSQSRTQQRIPGGVK